MSCNNNNTFHSGKALLYTVDNSSQVVAAAGNVVLGSTVVSSGRGIDFISGSTAITLDRVGIYKVTVSADILADAAGSTILALYNNGTAVNGAEATYTAVADGIAHLSFSGLVQVTGGCRCVSNTANLTLQLSAAGAVSNVAIVVEKVA